MQVQKIRKNLSTGDLRPSKITTRSYTLDRESAMHKKINACQKEHLRFELKPGKNFVIELSTGAYETVKSEILNILQRPEITETLVTLPIQEGIEKSGLTVDSCYKVFNKKLNGDAGSLLKSTINLYYTTCKINVNGSRIDLFINNIFDKICEKLRIEYRDINILNNSIHSYLSQLKSSSSNTIHRTIKQEENKKENQIKEIISEEEYVSPLKVDEINNTDTNQAILETTKNKQSIKERNKSSSFPLKTDTNTPDNFMCPCCNKYVEEGIGCDRCDYWYHFQCENLTSKTGENEFRHKDNICTLCNDDILYDTRNLVKSEPMIQEDEVDSTEEKQNEKQNNENQSESEREIESEDMEETELKTCISTGTKNSINQESEKINQRIEERMGTMPCIPNGNSSKQGYGITPTQQGVKKNHKGAKNKNDKEEIITAQKTRILNLENEIKHMKTVLDTIVQRGENKANEQPSDHTSETKEQSNTQYAFQQLQSQMKEMIMENRLKTIENQMVQNMCMQTAITTQMALQIRHYSPYPCGTQQSVPGVVPHIPPNPMQHYTHLPQGIPGHVPQIPPNPMQHFMHIPQGIPGVVHHITPNTSQHYMHLPPKPVQTGVYVSSNPSQNFMHIPPNLGQNEHLNPTHSSMHIAPNPLILQRQMNIPSAYHLPTMYGTPTGICNPLIAMNATTQNTHTTLHHPPEYSRPVMINRQQKPHHMSQNRNEIWIDPQQEPVLHNYTRREEIIQNPNNDQLRDDKTNSYQQNSKTDHKKDNCQQHQTLNETSSYNALFEQSKKSSQIRNERLNDHEKGKEKQICTQTAEQNLREVNSKPISNMEIHENSSTTQEDQSINMNTKEHHFRLNSQRGWPPEVTHQKTTDKERVIKTST
ncbi:unnamed protein product [Mytilus coruscus]|uniref:PHD-type domain-containing protein n=1 Tax=Mytilus coruscus TaxID=42192 RepID=A0A6J8BTG1_MYTCO|nr:unnamed protein product [Mytilus coruscus]